MIEDDASQSVQTRGLYVVASPIGHLGDLSTRAIAVLRQVEWVACEDTRVSRPLLKRLGSQARTLAAHQHNERSAGEHIVALLAEGQSVALLSDAGTPAVSDPGAKIVSAVLEAGYRVIPIPGPSALTALASASGIIEGAFRFEGFLPARPASRRQRLETLAHADCPIIVFEAPHRIADTLEAIATLCGPTRWLAIGRELTKKFEEVTRLQAGQALDWLKAEPLRSRGEFVAVIAPAGWDPGSRGAERDPATAGPATDPDHLTLSLDALLRELVAELGANRASRMVERLGHRSHRDIYPRAVALANELNRVDSGGAA